MPATIRPAPPCRRSSREKIKRAENFNQGYKMTELLAAAELDMQWHTLPVERAPAGSGSIRAAGARQGACRVRAVPPRYRSSYFQHIWAGGYSAGYYAYLWTEMLADDAFQWFEENGGLTRANGDRFRRMILSSGNTEDLARFVCDLARPRAESRRDAEIPRLDRALEARSSASVTAAQWVMVMRRVQIAERPGGAWSCPSDRCRSASNVRPQALQSLRGLRGCGCPSK